MKDTWHRSRLGKWCGLCYENVRGRANHGGHFGHRPSRDPGETVMVFDARRQAPPGRDGEGQGGAAGAVAPGRFPLVLQFLTLAKYGDGSPREPGSITLFSDAGVVKACLNDKDAGLAAFVSGDGVEGALESAERGLEGDRLDWRQAKRKGARR